jgi:hypothetical protein
MQSKAFYKWLVLISILLSVMIVGMSFIPGFEGTLGISLFSLLFFVLLNIGVYYLGLRSARSEDKNSLTRLIMLLVFLKMISCLLIVIIYDQGWKPSTNHYIIPFFAIYVSYTIFEVDMLSKISKMKI